MAEPTLSAFLGLVRGRRGHFRLESGHHGTLWLDLDPLFAQPGAIAPFVAVLTARLEAHAVDVVCGPLLGGALLAQLVAQSLGAGFAFTERRSSESDGLYAARYDIPPAFGPRLRGRRVALVDDVMSAGSALRATRAALEAHGARPVVVGALLVLGTAGAGFFDHHHVRLEAVLRDSYELWAPEVCPLCLARQPLEDPSSPAA